MRILQLIPTLAGGGAERQLAYLSVELRCRGHDVLVGYFAPGAGAWPVEVPVNRFPSRNPWNPRLIRDLFRLMRAWQPDVVQTCLARMDVAGGIAAALAGVPLVVREPTMGDSYERGPRSHLRTTVVRTTAAAIVANSTAGADYWARAAPRVPRYVIGNAVPVEAIAATPPVARSGTAAVGVYAGRLEPMKNVDILLRSSALVMADRDLLLTVCGEGRDRARLAALVKELGIETRVRFTGFVRNAWSHQRGADFVALLSDFEGHPNAALESFAAGTPTILSDIPAHRDLAAGSAAVLVPLRDVAATAAAIRDVLDDRPAALERARRARGVVADCSIETMTAAILDVYATVVGRAAR